MFFVYITVRYLSAALTAKLINQCKQLLIASKQESHKFIFSLQVANQMMWGHLEWPLNIDCLIRQTLIWMIYIEIKEFQCILQTIEPSKLIRGPLSCSNSCGKFYYFSIIIIFYYLPRIFKAEKEDGILFPVRYSRHLFRPIAPRITESKKNIFIVQN